MMRKMDKHLYLMPMMDFRFRTIPNQNKSVSDITDITLGGSEIDGQTLVYDVTNGDYRFRSILYRINR